MDHQRYSRYMGAKLTLTAALSRTVRAYVMDAKVGPRRGSIAAFARAMTDGGVRTSKSTLNRKLDGAYPFDTDDIAVIADIVGVEPDAIWRQAVALMNEPPAETLSEHIIRQLSPEAQVQVREAKAAVTRKAAENGPTG